MGVQWLYMQQVSDILVHYGKRIEYYVNTDDIAE